MVVVVVVVVVVSTVSRPPPDPPPPPPPPPDPEGEPPDPPPADPPDTESVEDGDGDNTSSRASKAAQWVLMGASDGAMVAASALVVQAVLNSFKACRKFISAFVNNNNKAAVSL